VKSLLVVGVLAGVAAAEPGYTVALGGGLNVGHPFVDARLGHRWSRVEVALDYSYDAKISELPFQTFGVAVRTFLTTVGPVELFHQASASFALSSSGTFDDRQLGDRLLGGFFTQGLGAEYAIDPCWSVALTVSTGYPVWLRPELAVKFTW
jgi:hypothetical protein